VSDDEPDEHYELEMPFLPVISNGEPYDDDAYVAGFEMGRLDKELETGGAFGNGQPIHVENREQADLIAMRRGYTAEFTDEQNGWVCMSVWPMHNDV
jgi:hypothetical protein